MSKAPTLVFFTNCSTGLPCNVISGHCVTCSKACGQVACATQQHQSLTMLVINAVSCQQQLMQDRVLQCSETGLCSACSTACGQVGCMLQQHQSWTWCVLSTNEPSSGEHAALHQKHRHQCFSCSVGMLFLALVRSRRSSTCSTACGQVACIIQQHQF